MRYQCVCVCVCMCTSSLQHVGYHFSLIIIPRRHFAARCRIPPISRRHAQIYLVVNKTAASRWLFFQWAAQMQVLRSSLTVILIDSKQQYSESYIGSALHRTLPQWSWQICQSYSPTFSNNLLLHLTCVFLSVRLRTREWYLSTSTSVDWGMSAHSRRQKLRTQLYVQFPARATGLL